MYKKIIFVFIGTSFIWVFLIFGALFSYDPLKIFHKPWIYKNYLQKNMREQAAGIINNWDFDSVIIGTSMLENTSSKEASKKLGGNFVNISLSGSDFYEREIVLGYALKKRKIKTVIYSLDNLGSTRKVDKSYKVENWNYLYDDNPFNDIKAYLNNKYLSCLFLPVTRSACMGHIADNDRPNAWYMYKDHSKRFGGLDNWFKANNNSQIKEAFSSILSSIKKIKAGETLSDNNMTEHIKDVKNYLDLYIIKLVKKYPETEFIFIDPPYSRIKYAIDAQYNKTAFKKHNEALKYLVEKSKIYPNMKIYAWGNNDFVDDIANYKDLHHYEYKINSWMLREIKNKKGLLIGNNIDNYLKIFTQKALNYNLFVLGDKIDKYLHLESNKMLQ